MAVALPVSVGVTLDQRTLEAAARSGLLAPPQQRIALFKDDYQALIFLLRRYFLWVDSGRQQDAWLQSGVARSSWSTTERVSTGAPGSRPPVAAAGPEADHVLLSLDRHVMAQPPHIVALLRWKSVAGETDAAGRTVRLSNEQIAARLGCAEATVKALWRSAGLAVLNQVMPR